MKKISHKNLKCRKQRKDFEKKRAILNSWKKENANKLYLGKKQSLMPVNFPTPKKYTAPKKKK